MKILKHITIACIFLLNTAGYAQTIDSLQFVPSHTQSSDTKYIICYATLPSSDCWLKDSDMMSINDSIIEVSAYYYGGGYASLCTSVDTLSLGELSVGKYTLKYYLYDSSNISNKYSLEDTAIIEFSTAKSTILKEHSKENAYLKIHHHSKYIEISYSLPKNTKDRKFRKLIE